MFTDQTLGKHSVALFQRFDNVHMVDDGATGAIIFADGAGADAAQMNKQIVGYFINQAALAQA